MTNYTLYDLNAPATWFDKCGILQQTWANDDQGVAPKGTYIPSTVWTDFTAMFSDFLIEGSQLQNI